METLIYINLIFPVILIILSIVRFKQIRQVSKLGLIIPSLYVLFVYLNFVINPDNPIRLQVQIRIMITLLLLSITILLSSDILAYNIKNGNHNES